MKPNYAKHPKATPLDVIFDLPASPFVTVVG